MPAPLDLANQRFGRLFVVRFAGMKGPHRAWLCRCDCGNEMVTRGSSLSVGGVKSCGCYTREIMSKVTTARNLKHGQSRRKSRTRTYQIWVQLPHRRFYKLQPPVCSRWRKSFTAFLSDMGACPTPKHTIDRIDNGKGYAPSNCRWATMKEQQNNRTNNRRLILDGLTLTLMQWSEKTGIPRSTISARIDRLNWPVEKALTTPVL